jgi:RNA polymerase sigma-70 factor (ECF subfamily)
MSRAEAATAIDDLERYRPLLFSIAYRMLGEVGDAEDLVQETYLRAQRAVAGGTGIDQPKSFLAEVVTRLAIDHLRSARVRRERYVGQWLPEPLLSQVEPEPDVADRTAFRESVSMAFMVVLETLSPVERAVFLLHDVFGFEFDEIARIVERSTPNCRQVAVRARRHIDDRRPRFAVSDERRNELTGRFFAAAQSGDVEGLVTMLSEDVVMVGDGGGHGALVVPAGGAVRVARFMAGVTRAANRQGLAMAPAVVNGEPGAVVYWPDGSVATVLAIHVAGEQVAGIYSVVNPEKLAHVPRLPGR